jgi:hypothetical protein
VEPKNPLPYSQESISGPSPEPDKSSPHTCPPYSRLTHHPVSVHTPFHLIYLRLIVSSLRCLDLQNGLFPSGVVNKISCPFLISPSHAAYPSHLILNLTVLIWWRVCVTTLLLMRFSSFLSLLSLKSKRSPQHPVLRHPQSVFFPKCERPSSTPKQNNRWNNIFLYIVIFMF